jgi:hypothetical protein
MNKQKRVASEQLTPLSLPAGYRQSVVTAITVFVGFSLAFLRFWGIENPGDWTFRAIVSELVVGAGAVVQLVALFRALDIRDDNPARYQRTVKIFAIGVLVVLAGVVASILVAASGDGSATPTPAAG